jgi:DNA polymerase (family 10)
MIDEVVMVEMMNVEIARRLDEVADLLSEQDATPFRTQAYRHAADTLRALPRSLSEIVHQEGMAGLQKLPGIGDSLARSIHTLVTTGRLPMLERLRGEIDAVALLASVPGVGQVLARRLHHDLGIDTLEDLDASAYNGRLANLAGVGPKRLAGIIDAVATRLRRIRGRPHAAHAADEPPIGELLDVDREYRDKVAVGKLPKIAPRRFNPTGGAWLPVLHTERGGRHYTALFSNTARAHQFGMTHDWVVLYYDDGRGEQQCTVITSQRGRLKGQRIVRGREAECASYYQASSA